MKFSCYCVSISQPSVLKITRTAAQDIIAALHYANFICKTFLQRDFHAITTTVALKVKASHTQLTL